MGESHTKGSQLHRPVVPEETSGQSPMTRISYGKPFKPYVYGGDEPAAVTGARERHRRISAEIARRQEAAMDDTRAIDLIVDQTGHAVHGGWELRDGYIVCAWDGERIAEAPGGSHG